MLVVITYDINTETTEGCRRLRRVANLCKNYGQRVQKSVFECVVNPTQWLELETMLKKAIRPDQDSMRFYFLGSNWDGKVEHFGVNGGYDPVGILIV
jgi:CRISPR-associated protein Cas2